MKSDDPASGKTIIRFFVSYAHREDTLADRLLNRLRRDLNLSKKFFYEFWQDTAIDSGEHWHERIQSALEKCDFGLALISVDFLSSAYIREHELPALLVGEKLLIPVGLGPIDFQRHDLRGLEERQIFRYPEPGREARFYADCTGRIAERFAAQLAEKIEGIVDKSLRARKEALLREALADPENAARIVHRMPQLDEALATIAKQPQQDIAADASLDPAALRELARRTVPPEIQKLIPATAAGMSLAEAESIARAQRSGDADDTDAALRRFETQRRDAVRFLADWFRRNDAPPFAAVLGEIGAGKTTMLQMLTRALNADAGQDPAAPPVFFVDLKDYLGSKDATLEAILTDLLRRHDPSGKLKPTDLIHAVQKLGALIVFDGLDEKIIPLNDEQRVAFIRELWRVLPPDTMDRQPAAGRGKLVISCRSHYFPSVVAQTSGFLGQRAHGIGREDYTACIMLPWNDEQIADYLAQHLGAEKVADALAIIASVHNLADLSRRPYLLSLIAPQIADLEKKRAAGEPVNGASLYQQFTDTWLHRDDGKHKFTREHKLLMMERLAADLWRENAREWPWSRVAEWLDIFLYENPVIAARYSRDHVPADILNQDFRTATFFLRPDSSKDGFRFAHTGVLEFFLASRLIKSLAQPGAATVWDLPTPSLETFDFAGQILETLSRSDCDRALTGLRALLENAANPERARLVAFTFLVRAAKHGHPVPETVAVQAREFDLTAWKISGAEDRPLRLDGADFSSATLIRASFRWVEMPGSCWHGADLCSAEFIGCGLEKAEFFQSRLEGVRFRHCHLAGSRVAGSRLVGIRIEPGTWDTPTGQHWSDTFATCCSTAFTDPCSPIHPISVTPDATWSLSHSNSVWSAAFSPDGSRIVSGSHERTREEEVRMVRTVSRAPAGAPP